MLAEIGIWRNLLAIESETRRSNIEHACNCLAIADAIGAKCAVSYIGSLAPETDYALHPDNMGMKAFDATVETVRLIIDSVKPRCARFALEMTQYALPDSVDSYVDLIAAIDRPAFAVHLDPVNLIMTPCVYFNNRSLLEERFAKLGTHIVSCHAKDIVLHHREALHFDEVMIGDEALDYPAYLRLLDALPTDVLLILEHLEDSAYGVARDRLFAIAEGAGIGFVH
ncbi:MAG: TIM barrel protein [Candidatus Devosia euplotis]|nr:TIM barrel protein [Candidatus Devosia euplotis]